MISSEHTHGKYSTLNSGTAVQLYINGTLSNHGQRQHAKTKLVMKNDTKVESMLNPEKLAPPAGNKMRDKWLCL